MQRGNQILREKRAQNGFVEGTAMPACQASLSQLTKELMLRAREVANAWHILLSSEWNSSRFNQTSLHV